MGPENTLILIDGVPVTSRNSVRYSWRGERDTRGDTNWVPPEQVERIEVIRGLRRRATVRGSRGGEHHYQTSHQRLARFAVVIHQPAGK